jgi:hypothetical protein
MGDFFESDENPVGACIWEDCKKPAVVTMNCRSRPVVMDVCREHAGKFDSAEIVPGEGDSFGISFSGKMDSPAEVERQKRLKKDIKVN